MNVFIYLKVSKVNEGADTFHRNTFSDKDSECEMDKHSASSIACKPSTSLICLEHQVTILQASISITSHQQVKN